MKKTALLFTVATLCLGARAGAADDAAIAAQVNALYKNLPVDEARMSPLPGIAEVVTGKNIVYVHLETGHILFGELWTKEGRSLTNARRQEFVASRHAAHTAAAPDADCSLCEADTKAARLANLPLDKAVKIGSGKNVVIEITDPDCPHCRKGSTWLDEQEDVTRYVFFLPLRDPAKISFILGSKDPEETYHAAVRGHYDAPGSVPAVRDPVTVALLLEHQNVARALGVTGTPAYWVNGEAVSGANLPRIQKLLSTTR